MKSLSDVGRTEARSRGHDCPEGVTDAFHVSLNKVEPSEAVTACNLLAKNDVRTALSDEMEERRPQVPLVIEPAAFACRAERLTRAGTGPHVPVVGPPGVAQGATPDADAGEGVELDGAPNIVRRDVADVTGVDLSGRDQVRGAQVLQPRGRVGLDLVVEDHAAASATWALRPLRRTEYIQPGWRLNFAAMSFAFMPFSPRARTSASSSAVMRRVSGTSSSAHTVR